MINANNREFCSWDEEGLLVFDDDGMFFWSCCHNLRVRIRSGILDEVLEIGEFHGDRIEQIKISCPFSQLNCSESNQLSMKLM